MASLHGPTLRQRAMLQWYRLRFKARQWWIAIRYSKTRAALEGSVQKWERIVARVGADHGTDNCPLCTLFFWGTKGSATRVRVDGCHSCPVYKRTGQIGCCGTPYNLWEDHKGLCYNENHPRHFTVQCSECLKHAEAEVEFLKSLRKEVQ